MDRAEATKLMKGGLGRAELQFAASIVAPLGWVWRQDGKKCIRNGSTYFLDCGSGPFAVTAAHVLAGYREAKRAHGKVSCQVGDLVIDPEARLIDFDASLDLATLKISAKEIAAIGKTVLTGHQRSWPPAPPKEDRGIYFAGFPGHERLWISEGEVSWGVLMGGGVATSVSDRDVSSQAERENWIDVLGRGLPPIGFDMSGVSGGPMLSVVEHAGIRSWRLAGTIYEGPGKGEIEGFEVVRARRADFITPNGTLDRARLF